MQAAKVSGTDCRFLVADTWGAATPKCWQTSADTPSRLPIAAAACPTSPFPATVRHDWRRPDRDGLRQGDKRSSREPWRIAVRAGGRKTVATEPATARKAVPTSRDEPMRPTHHGCHGQRAAATQKNAARRRCPLHIFRCNEKFGSTEELVGEPERVAV